MPRVSIFLLCAATATESLAFGTCRLLSLAEGPRSPGAEASGGERGFRAGSTAEAAGTGEAVNRPSFRIVSTWGFLKQRHLTFRDPANQDNTGPTFQALTPMPGAAAALWAHVLGFHRHASGATNPKREARRLGDDLCGQIIVIYVHHLIITVTMTIITTIITIRVCIPANSCCL